MLQQLQAQQNQLRLATKQQMHSQIKGGALNGKEDGVQG